MPLALLCKSREAAAAAAVVEILPLDGCISEHFIERRVRASLAGVVLCVCVYVCAFVGRVVFLMLGVARLRAVFSFNRPRVRASEPSKS